MRKSKLQRREVEVCERLRTAREYLGVTQQACAKQIGIERSTLTNYEAAVTPLRYEVALRFCRHLIISEEWLATGRFDAMKSAAEQRGFNPGMDWKSLQSIFLRQCMDLLSEQACQKIPPGTLFSEAYDRFLVLRYAELAAQYFYTPRIVFSETDTPELGANLISAYVERWLKLLSNEALRLKRNSWEVQRSFIRALIEADAHIFRKFLGFPQSSRESAQLEWLRISLMEEKSKLGPLHAKEMEIPRYQERPIEVFSE